MKNKHILFVARKKFDFLSTVLLNVLYLEIKKWIYVNKILGFWTICWVFSPKKKVKTQIKNEFLKTNGELSIRFVNDIQETKEFK